MKAIDVGKIVAIDASKKLVEKAVKKLSKPKSQVANVMVPPEEITKKVKLLPNILIPVQLTLRN